MCGIAGLLDLSGVNLADASLAGRMAAYLNHRGPEEEGFYSSGPVAFGFRRLKIIDLKTGHQPLPNEQGTVWVMCNGEIYNFVELRSELEKKGHSFKTQSDTEVIVHAYESYGLDFVHYLRGMFAISLWDDTQKRLVLVRDRIGKKPLIYSVADNQLAFASEIKALLAWPHLKRSINTKALHDYLTLLYVPTPESIFENVYKLPPAHMFIADCRKKSFSLSRYWEFCADPDYGKSKAFYVNGLREILTESVRIRSRSDVPLGVLLSGGIDSTIITGLLSREVSPVRTFTIGFSEKSFDETRYAKLAADLFKTEHIQNTLDVNSIGPDEFKRLVWYMDEPFGDSSYIPTYLASRMARQYVKVVLSGDGGDELFAGYPGYHHLRMLKWLNILPAPFRITAQKLVTQLRNFKLLQPFALDGYLRKAQKLCQLSMLKEEEQVFALLTYFDESSKAMLYSDNWRNRIGRYTTWELFNQKLSGTAYIKDPLVRSMARDFQTNMVDDCLVKVDKASMANSLEVRSPFLDHCFVEFAMKIPPEYKLRYGKHKIILKQAFRDLLPKRISQRRKQGFEIPFSAWFQKEPWRSFLLDMLSQERLRRQGIFNPAEVINLRDQFLRNPQAHGLDASAYQLRHRIWMLFIFQAWYEQFMP